MSSILSRKALKVEYHKQHVYNYSKLIQTSVSFCSGISIACLCRPAVLVAKGTPLLPAMFRLHTMLGLEYGVGTSVSLVLWLSQRQDIGHFLLQLCYLFSNSRRF